MPAMRVRGTELANIEQGTGEPLVFVHGSIFDYRAWGLQLAPFSQHFQVVAYSRRYHHPNPWTGDGLDYAAPLHAEDLAAFIHALGLGPAHLVGSSAGAYVALLLAARHPDLVRTLVLGEPPMLAWLAQSVEGEPLYARFLAEVWVPTGQAL